MNHPPSYSPVFAGLVDVMTIRSTRTRSPAPDGTVGYVEVLKSLFIALICFCIQSSADQGTPVLMGTS